MSIPTMPKPVQQRLTPAELRKLEAADRRVVRALGQVDDARMAWAKLVRELGISAVARARGLTPAAISERLRLIERREG